MKKLLAYLLILGILFGIIPAMLVVLMAKSTLFTIVMIVVAIGFTMKELCF